EHDELERIYGAIRADTELRTGHSVSERRISALACRRAGTDCEAKVGGRDPLGGAVVVAIFGLGRDHYAIRCADSALDPDWLEPIVVDRHQVYSVTDFGD